MIEAIRHMQTKNKILIVLATVSVVSLGTTFAFTGGKANAVVGGPSCTVGASGADYTTIQAAVNDSGCTTVKVKAGTYAENVQIDRSVKIKGAKAGDNVKFRTFGAGNESTVTGTSSDTPVFTVNAANVVIDGFSISNIDHTIGVTIKTAGNDAKIRNNIVDGVGSSSYGQPTVGVYLEYGPDGVNVSGNRISNVQAGGKSAQGVLIGDSTSTNPSSDIEIDSNTIANITSNGGKGAYGINANNGAGSTGYTEVKIRANTISNLTGGWVHAIGLEGKTPNAVVRYNKVSGLNSVGADKVGVYFEDNDFFFSATVNRNDLNVGVGAFGVAVSPALSAAYPTLSVDAECNYWGASNGPGFVASGSGSMVGPNVDHSPWLKSSNLDARCDNKWGHDKDDDNHHGDFDCKYDDRRDWKYND